MPQAGAATQQQYRRTSLGNPPTALLPGELFVDISRGTAASPTNTRPNAGLWVGGTGANDVRTVLPSTQGVPLPSGQTGTIYYPGYNNQTGDFTWQPGTTSGGTVTSVSMSGGTTGLTFNGGPITTMGTFTAGGTLAVANGGTGTATVGQALDNIGPVQSVATNGQFLGSNGTNSAWTSILQVPSPTAGQAGYTLRATGAGTYTWNQTLPAANGGTGYSTYTPGAMLFGNPQDGTLSVLARNNSFASSLFVLQLDQVSGTPVWGTLASAIPSASGQTGKFLGVTGTNPNEVVGWQFLAASDIPNLDASKITTGTISLARGGTGANLSATGGTGQVVRQSTAGGAFTVSALGATDIPTLDASKIASGQITAARGGTGQDFSASSGIIRVSAGVFSAGALAANDIPVLDASKITTGSFDTARIPNLDASKITTGSFDAARIPNLDASKITSGTLPSAVNLSANSATRLFEPFSGAASATSVDLNSGSLFTITLSGTTTLTVNNIGLSANQARTFAVFDQSSSTAAFINAISIAGASSTTVRWAGGSGAPTTGTTGFDLYQISVWCTSSGTYSVFASLVSYT